MRSEQELIDLGETPSSIAYLKVVDANVEAVREKLLQRSQVGIKKYGTTTQRDDLTFDEWLVHLQEELMDAAVYIQATLNNKAQ